MYGYYLQQKSLLPKIIWTYWDDPDTIPKTVTMCMKGWQKYNPDYQIILLTKNTYMDYVHIPMASNPNFHDNPTRLADLIRIWALAEHGGIWIDSSTILKGSLDDWIFPFYAIHKEFSGFYHAGMSTTYPMIENWFFACKKGSPFVRQWRDEFSKLSDYPNVEAYVESRKKMGINIEKIYNPRYLTMHVAAQKVIQLDNYPLDNLFLQKAEDGPFRYLADKNWDSEKGLELACSNKSYQGPIMKIRGKEREIVEKKIEGYLSADTCGWLD